MSYSGMSGMSGMAAPLTQFSNGAVAQALIQSRDATFNEVGAGCWAGQFLPPKTWESAGLSWDINNLKFNKSDTLDQSGQHIRMYLYAMELFGNVKYTETAATAAAGPKLKIETHAAIAQPLSCEIERPQYSAFLAELKIVESWATRRDERGAEILTQTVPQLPFWASVCSLQPHRAPYTLELTDCALGFAMMVVMRFKQAFNCPRPSEYSPNIQPMLPVPPFSSFPSGHATESRMFADMFCTLTMQNINSQMTQQLNLLTQRIAENREVAGLHFKMDSIAGDRLGRDLASWFCNYAADSNGHVNWLWKKAQTEVTALGY